MKRKYTYKGTDGNGGFISGTTHKEHGSMAEALGEINKRVHTCLKLETESPSSSCSRCLRLEVALKQVVNKSNQCEDAWDLISSMHDIAHEALNENVPIDTSHTPNTKTQ